MLGSNLMFCSLLGFQIWTRCYMDTRTTYMCWTTLLNRCRWVRFRTSQLAAVLVPASLSTSLLPVRSTRLPSGAIIIAFHGFEINTVVEHAREEGRGKKIDPTRFDVELECASKVWNNRPIDRQKWDFNFETVRNLIWKILKLKRLRKMAINSAQGPYDPQNDSTFYGINCPKGNAHPLHNNNFN